MSLYVIYALTGGVALFVLAGCFYALIGRLDSCAIGLRKQLKNAEVELEQLHEIPEYVLDLPTYENKAIREEIAATERKIRVLTQALAK